MLSAFHSVTVSPDRQASRVSPLPQRLIGAVYHACLWFHLCCVVSYARLQCETFVASRIFIQLKSARSCSVRRSATPQNLSHMLILPVQQLVHRFENLIVATSVEKRKCTSVT